MGVLKWDRDGGEGMVSSLSIAGIDVTAFVGDPYVPIRSELECTSDLLGDAEQQAEQRLREMHAALSEAFAPVLRWERDLHSIAKLGKWVLEADSSSWMVSVKTTPQTLVTVASAETERVDRVVNHRAAEEALRSLGVVFRVDGKP